MKKYSSENKKPKFLKGTKLGYSGQVVTVKGTKRVMGGDCYTLEGEDGNLGFLLISVVDDLWKPIKGGR